METPADETKPHGFFRGLLRGIRFGRNGDSSLRETFEELIEQHEENEPPVDPVARAMLDKVLTVGALTVSDVMVPRADIIAVDVSIERNEILKLLVEESHSRMPVYRGNLDDVLGMIHIKDSSDVTISGLGFESGSAAERGGCLFVDQSNVKVEDTDFMKCIARATDYQDDWSDTYGGGMCVDSGSSATVSSSSFTSCTATVSGHTCMLHPYPQHDIHTPMMTLDH